MTSLRQSQLRAALAVLLVAGMLAACNTTAGVGEDVSATGRAVSGTAKKVQDKM